MAHNIEVVNGEASFFANRVPAWHNLGTVVDGAKTWKEAIQLAKMNWKVKKEQDVHPRLKDDDGKPLLINSYSIYREDNDKWLGKVGDRYTPIQNEFQFSFMDSILGEEGEHYETAGVLGNGERIFVLANLASEHDIHGSGDIHKAYLAGMTSHDGSTSARFFTTEVRIVCQNTLEMALRGSKGSGVSVRHTRNAEDRLNARIKDLTEAKAVFSSTMEKLEALAERKVNGKDVQEILSRVFNVSDVEQEDIPTRTKNNIDFVKELLENNDKNTFPEFRGTAYNLLNSVTEYTDHFREVRMTDGRAELEKEEVRAESALFGNGANFKSKALEIILEATANAKRHDLHRSYSVPSIPDKIKGGAVLDDILANAQGV